MKNLVTIFALLAATAARAHDSLVSHEHPHGPSVLPDLDSLALAALVLAAGLIAFLKYGRR